ncbi:unnamed protein product [Peronospora belbahrii]|uniref:Uncharacterized protein n=1 Tax=Peronospora belbahrii TaxID=622444 RepID=A0AAU9KYR8_9STRA|nr:unnamed protein product [Peronospora belbahrii]
MSFIDGIPGSILSLVTEFQHKNQGVSWSILGALPRAAIERGDIEMLHQLTKLSRTKRFQCCPELVWNQTLSMKYAIQYGHVKMLQYVAETGTLHSEPNQEESAKIASNLLTWAVKYSNLFESRLELEIIQWVVKKYSHVAFMDVTAQDLSQASIPVLMYLKEKKSSNEWIPRPEICRFRSDHGKDKDAEVFMRQQN